MLERDSEERDHRIYFENSLEHIERQNTRQLSFLDRHEPPRNFPVEMREKLEDAITANYNRWQSDHKLRALAANESVHKDPIDDLVGKVGQA